MKKDKELLKKIRDRHKVMTTADDDNRRLAMQDIKFTNVPGEQWDQQMKVDRGLRPCYEFNKLRVTAKRIINEMRANRPSGKVRGAEGADKGTADIYEGLIRNIWNNSDGDSVIDNAAEYQVTGGMGAWRIDTEYASDNVFEQDIVINPIVNPFCLYADPASKDILKRDAEDWLLTEKISKTSYEARWPKAEKVDFDKSEFDDDDDWDDGESVRICEYWWKEPVVKEIWQLQDGKVIEADTDEAQAILETEPDQIKRKRLVNTHKIMMCIASGEAILEGPIEQAGKEHRFVITYGEYMIIDGKTYWFGIPRFAKDAQRSYNVSRTAITETIAQAPQAKWWATSEQAAGQTEKWAEAHKKNFPFLLYNADPKAPGAPQRMGGADVPIALIQESQLASEEIKAVTGIFSPDLGAGDNAKSGIQERERRAQGQLATFNYQDNQAKAVLRTWEILIDLIPHVYDTERELRVLGSDGAEEYKKVNTFVRDDQGNVIKINDLSVGRYDVTVTVGPSFTTQRQEAAETYSQLAQGNPQIMGVAGDLIFKSMDLPYSEDIAERLRAMLPPQIQQILNKDANVPPEVENMMSQIEQMVTMVEQQKQEAMAMAQEAEKRMSEADKEESKINGLMSDLDATLSKFDAEVAKSISKIIQKQSAFEVKVAREEKEDSNEDLSNEREQLSQQTQMAVNAISEMANQAINQATAVINELAMERESKPKIVRIESKRVNGNLVATPVYETVPDGNQGTNAGEA